MFSILEAMAAIWGGKGTAGSFGSTPLMSYLNFLPQCWTLLFARHSQGAESVKERRVICSSSEMKLGMRRRPGMLHSSDEMTAGGVPVYSDDDDNDAGWDVRLANLMRRGRSGFQGQGWPERWSLAADARAVAVVVSLPANSTNEGELLGESEVTLIAPNS